MNKEIDESPYCEICGTCGCIDCCGIRNFIAKHIEGKTNCKNEGWIIQDLINLCDYKDEVFKQNEKYKKVLDKIKEYCNNRLQYYNEMRSDYMKEFDGYAENDNENILELLEEIE